MTLCRLRCTLGIQFCKLRTGHPESLSGRINKSAVVAAVTLLPASDVCPKPHVSVISPGQYANRKGEGYPGMETAAVAHFVHLDPEAINQLFELGTRILLAWARRGGLNRLTSR